VSGVYVCILHIIVKMYYASLVDYYLPVYVIKTTPFPFFCGCFKGDSLRQATNILTSERASNFVVLGLPRHLCNFPNI
jgi:hypothetical protein